MAIDTQESFRMPFMAMKETSIYFSFLSTTLGLSMSLGADYTYCLQRKGGVMASSFPFHDSYFKLTKYVRSFRPLTHVPINAETKSESLPFQTRLKSPFSIVSLLQATKSVQLLRLALGITARKLPPLSIPRTRDICQTPRDRCRHWGPIGPHTLFSRSV